MRETALFLLPVWNLTSSSCSSTPISLWRGNSIPAIREIQSRNWHIYVCIDFQDILVQNVGVLGGGQNGEAVMRCWLPTNSLLLLRGFTSVPLLEKIDKKCDRESADRQTHTHRQRQTEYIICPMLYAIAMGGDKKLSVNHRRSLLANQ